MDVASDDSGNASGSDFGNAEPVVQYAVAELEQPADRLLRRIIAGTAIASSGMSISSTVVHFGLANGWLASPRNMSWAHGDAAAIAFSMLGLALAVGLLIGGFLLLKRRPAAIVLLRVCAIASLLTIPAGLATTLLGNPDYAEYWSTPGSAFLQALQYFHGAWIPILIGLLTLPPIAQRLV